MGEVYRTDCDCGILKGRKRILDMFLGGREDQAFGRIHTAAFPPIFNILCPASAARGCVHATIPFVLCTTLRLLANCTNGGLVLGKTASALNDCVVEPIVVEFQGMAVAILRGGVPVESI